MSLCKFVISGKVLVATLTIAGLFAYLLPTIAEESKSKSSKNSTRKMMIFERLHRLSEKPVISPRKDKFDEVGAFNPSCVKLPDGRVVMLYRAQDRKGVSRIGYAESKDGIHFNADSEPVLSPHEEDEAKGIEDPRLCKNPADPHQWYLTATAYNQNAQLALYRSNDLRHWHRVGIIMPAKKGTWNINWTKSGAIVPEKINGKYWMYYLGDTPDGCNQMGLASSEDAVHWKDATEHPVLPVRPGKFDSKVVEPGPAPIITDDGILFLYNGADDKLRYCTGWALFDKKDPAKLIARADEPIFEPEMEWEKINSSKEIYQAPNVVFVEGMVKDGDRYLVYYGGADSYVGVAETKLVPVK